jgi:hypothetical protein
MRGFAFPVFSRFLRMNRENTGNAKKLEVGDAGSLLRNSWERGRLGRKKAGAPVSSLRIGSTIGGLDAIR